MSEDGATEHKWHQMEAGRTEVAALTQSDIGSLLSLVERTAAVSAQHWPAGAAEWNEIAAKLRAMKERHSAEGGEVEANMANIRTKTTKSAIVEIRLNGRVVATGTLSSEAREVAAALGMELMPALLRRIAKEWEREPMAPQTQPARPARSDGTKRAAVVVRA